MEEVSIFWFRRDLRLDDNHGLFQALKSNCKVLPIFIFDKTILDDIEDKKDARVNFIYNTVTKLNSRLKDVNASINIFYGDVFSVWKSLINSKDFKVKNVYFNHDYEPYATQRDETITKLLIDKNIDVFSYKDHVVYEKNEILSNTGSPYKVYTPYKKKWLEVLNNSGIPFYDSEKLSYNFYSRFQDKIISLSDIGFSKSDIEIPPSNIVVKVIKEYHLKRDIPVLDATSKLGIHFRFGTVSIREKLKKAIPLNDIWVSELVWRDFFSQLLFHYPHVVTGAFNTKFDKIVWLNCEEHFELWKQGKTGYPLVDAGMRELNKTGHMHNRVRMVCASFLVKHLLVDWRWGEQYFAEMLLDFDLASNNGNWQWAAGCGADAAPYFRVFNPILQQQKFDPDFTYIKKWVHEFGSSNYPKPIVEHKFAVERCKNAYKVINL